MTDWPTDVHQQYLSVLDERDALQSVIDDAVYWLKKQKCEGFSWNRGKEQKLECVDTVPARTVHMCQRCRILLYLTWTHGFPRRDYE